jgi:hypothetical protein
MAGGNANNRAGFLSWAQFAWMVLSAIIGAAITATGAFYGLREQARMEAVTEAARIKAELTQELAQELRGYLPLPEYWKWREETNASLYKIGRQVDRIELRSR